MGYLIAWLVFWGAVYAYLLAQELDPAAPPWVIYLFSVFWPVAMPVIFVVGWCGGFDKKPKGDKP